MNDQSLGEQAKKIGEAREELSKGIVGQDGLIEGLFLAMAAGGHALLESVPGLAKSRAVALLAQVSGLAFRRIQFTPDLLPADITGTRIFNPGAAAFEVKKGPIFANFILADEINRAPAKVQSALLESMQERQVTIGDETFKLPAPFFVFATQNPVEQEGTYPLPEAQLDRFMLKLVLDYPTLEEEARVVNLVIQETALPKVRALLSAESILSLQAAVRQVHIEERLVRYLSQLVDATRHPKAYGLDLEGRIALGASPRASIALAQVSRARALFIGRGHVEPGDIKAVALPVLRHRVIPTYHAEAEGVRSVDLIEKILAAVKVP